MDSENMCREHYIEPLTVTDLFRESSTIPLYFIFSHIFLLLFRQIEICGQFSEEIQSPSLLQSLIQQQTMQRTERVWFARHSQRQSFGVMRSSLLEE